MSHICDIAGVRVGHASDAARRTGTTSIIFDEPAVCSVAIHGGAPGTRETDALRPGNLNPPVDAVVLSGGSAFGLAAADGAMRALHNAGRGYAVGPHRIPIVPAAIIFDLSSAFDLSGTLPNYAKLGRESVEAALAAPDRRVGTVGAGVGATTATLKGGIGSAVETTGHGSVGAIVAVNAVGAVTALDAPFFRAAAMEREGEFGGLRAPPEADFQSIVTKVDAAAGANTVIALIATDVALDTAEAQRLAVSAHDGLALAIWPSHTLFDGDTVFAASTGAHERPTSARGWVELHAAATRALARAITIGVHAATPSDGDLKPTWQALYGSASNP